MKDFKELGIKSKNLSGEKIAINEVLDKQIAVYDYRVEDSKYGKRDAKCLHLQIEVDGAKRVIFTGSNVLIDIISQIPQTAFPFRATIVKEMEWYNLI